MHIILQKASHLLLNPIHLLLGRIPQKLPRTDKAFDELQAKLQRVYGLGEHVNYRGVLAGTIMHLSPNDDRAPLIFFARALRKMLANEVAYKIIEEERDKAKATLKEKVETQIAAAKKLQAEPSLEPPATEQASS